MKKKLVLNVLLTLTLLLVNLPVFAKFSILIYPLIPFQDSILYYNPVVKINDECSGYLFPGTNIIWTLKKCISSKIDDTKIYTNINTSDSINPTVFFRNNEYFEKTLTFEKPEIIYQYNHWVLLQVAFPTSFIYNPILYIKDDSESKDTTIIGYPVSTDYNNDPVINYVDWILKPLWQYQVDTFIYNKQVNTNKIKLYSENDTNKYKQKLNESDKEYLVDVSNSNISYLNSQTTNKAIEFCLKRWTDHSFIRNRLATLSSLEDSPEIQKKMEELLEFEDKRFEIIGLASNLYITFTLIPIELLPSMVRDLIISFQKNYIQASEFLISQPTLLSNTINSIRSIQLLPIKKPLKITKRNNQDSLLNGNGNIQLIKSQKTKDFEVSGYWEVPGLDGGPIFLNGKLLGIHKEIPFYYAREIKRQQSLDFIPTEELNELKKEEKMIEIWQKISGSIHE